MIAVAMIAAFVLGFVGMGVLRGVHVEVPRPRRRRGESRVQRRRRWLRQAGAAVTPLQFYSVSAGCGLAVGGLVGLVGGAWLVALGPAVVAAIGPHVFFARRRGERLARIKRSWPDGLRDLAASVSARQPLHRALIELARTGPPPLRDAFAGYEANARVMGPIPALELIKEDVADPTTDRVIEVLLLALERNPGDLADLLTEMATSINQDLRTERDIDTARQEPKMSMYVAAAAPWLVLLGVTLMDGPYAQFYRSTAGLAPVVVSAAFTLAGVIIVSRLARDPVEVRLFADARASGHE